jgi:hypothetical protein
VPLLAFLPRSTISAFYFEQYKFCLAYIFNLTPS